MFFECVFCFFFLLSFAISCCLFASLPRHGSLKPCFASAFEAPSPRQRGGASGPRPEGDASTGEAQAERKQSGEDLFQKMPGANFYVLLGQR